MKQIYVKFALLGVGLLVTVVSGLTLAAKWNAVGDPITIDLAKMETGEKPPSRYVRVESYVPRPDHMFAWEFQYENVTNYQYFYPIVSPDNPAANSEAPLENFAIVVRPSSVGFDDEGTPTVRSEPLEGALAIGIDALEGPEKDFVRENYPNIDVNKVQVLIPGQKPWIAVSSFSWLAFGVLLTLVGAGSFMISGDE